jgi:hypothetical protein
MLFTTVRRMTTQPPAGARSNRRKYGAARYAEVLSLSGRGTAAAIAVPERPATAAKVRFVGVRLHRRPQWRSRKNKDTTRAQPRARR